MDRFKFNFEIKYVTLGLGLLITLIGCVVYLLFADVVPQIKEVMTIVGAGLALTALLYNAMNLHFNLKLNEKKVSNEKKVFSATLMSEWHKPEMVKLTIIGSKLRMNIKNLETQKILELLRQDQDAHNAMVAMLNFFEKMAICIENEVADEDLLKNFFHGIVNGYYTALRGLIEHKRIELEDPKVCMYFERLALRWGR